MTADPRTAAAAGETTTNPATAGFTTIPRRDPGAAGDTTALRMDYSTDDPKPGVTTIPWMEYTTHQEEQQGQEATKLAQAGRGASSNTKRKGTLAQNRQRT